ncbi:hypothetical protein CEUSTIGMA_g3576.t1 [Chlamydomonas eustigma]|uniref:Uncharacterized protein n=1 Tax=Chlamydomonas eustigma TaxID=1157962 RepID=A0A250WZ63_9CHLO|nr:hypothetical protein CEUSTIGMA_g3576.t1 [Chlamydomonas eustigma]|eukprot:GAX76133.1 hypothetical protein CEUSTIGMA_g3576.t1 [Chlamydomonas eustigma]
MWRNGPVVLLMLRRPGCALCRYQAREMRDYLTPQLDLLGVRMVCVILEEKKNEVYSFCPAYWQHISTYIKKLCKKCDFSFFKTWLEIVIDFAGSLEEEAS